MAYCEVTDVQSEFKDITFGTSTKVTSTEVTAWIAQADAKINSYLGAKYEVPITGTEALLVVKNICVELVANRARRVLQVKTGQAETEQDTRGIRTDTQIINELKEIAKGNIPLSDATLNASIVPIKQVHKVEVSLALMMHEYG